MSERLFVQLGKFALWVLLAVPGHLLGALIEQLTPLDGAHFTGFFAAAVAYHLWPSLLLRKAPRP